jgi:hypothetical protein
MISPKKCLLSSVAALSLLGMPLSSTAQTGSAAEPKVQPKIEPQAIAILKAMGERLAATRSLKFTAVTTYESPSRIGATTVEAGQPRGLLPWEQPVPVPVLITQESQQEVPMPWARFTRLFQQDVFTVHLGA